MDTSVLSDVRHADNKKYVKKVKKTKKFKKERKDGNKSTKNRQKETRSAKSSRKGKTPVEKEKIGEKVKSLTKTKEGKIKKKSIDGATRKKGKKSDNAKNGDDPDKIIYVQDGCFNVSIQKVNVRFLLFIYKIKHKRYES